MKIIAAEQTCWSCPSQWTAVTDDGKTLYLRYRFGHGTAQIDGPAGELVADFVYGDSYDGTIDLETFCAQAGIEDAT